jgi:hypothetical protein
VTNYGGWTNLDAEQMQRLGQLIDSRVRLLGEPYGRAVEACAPDRVGDENRRWIEGRK